MNRGLYAKVRRGYRVARRHGWANWYCAQWHWQLVETFFPPVVIAGRLPRGPRARRFCDFIPPFGFYQGMDLWKRVGLREACRAMNAVPYPRSRAA